MTARTTVFSALALATLAGAAQAQTCSTISKFDNGVSAAANDAFGQAVSMSFGGPNNCPLIAVGEPNEDAPVAGDNAGGFTVYHKPFGTWVELYGQWNSTGVAGEQLGACISLADPYLIAGAPGFDGGNGRARIYRRPSNGSGYTGPVDVLPGLGGIGSGFGRAVAVSAFGGGWAVVGAPTHDFHGEVDAGAAFFYTRDDSDNSWHNTYTIWGGDFGGNTQDHRGTAVAMAQVTAFAAVGSPDRERTGEPANHGTVRVVTRLPNGFVSGQSVEVYPPSPEQDEHFGAAVAIENEILVVGAPDEDMTLQEGGFFQQAIDGGAIYIFQKDAASTAWNFVAKLRSPSPVSDGHFGARVATDGGLQIVVSEPGTKRVYLYSSSGGAWHYQATVSDPDAANAGQFGSGVGVLNGDIAIGDALDDNNSQANAGAVYMLNLEHDIPTGDTCANPLQIPAGDFVGCTEFATPSGGASDVTTCGNGGAGQGNDVWFAFSPDCSGNAIFDTFGSQFDTVLSVHSDCPTHFDSYSMACNDDASFPAPNNRASLVTFNFTAGQTYFIRVAAYNGASGQFTLRHLYTFSSTNDTCASANVLGSNFGTFPFNTCSAGSDLSVLTSCAGGIYHDVWYRWNASQNRSINLNTCGSSFDTVIVVYQGTQQNCPVAGSPEVACNDDSVNICAPGTSLQSNLTFTAVAGQSYLIRVGSYINTGGPGQLTVQPAPCRADFNNDGFVNSQDFFDFLSAFFSLLPTADINADNTINSQDFFDFLSSFFTGC